MGVQPKQREIEVMALAGLSWFLRGEEDALALKPGDVFRGAMPAALNAGLKEGSLQYRCYVSGYMTGIKERFPDGVLVHRETHKIVEA